MVHKQRCDNYCAEVQQVIKTAEYNGNLLKITEEIQI